MRALILLLLVAVVQKSSCDSFGDYGNIVDVITSPPVSNSTIAPQTLCVLPPYPRHGTYTPSRGFKPGDAVPHTALICSCEWGYRLIGEALPICYMGEWYMKMPTCESQCKPLNSTSVEFKCYMQNSNLEISCKLPQDNNSRAKATCKDPYSSDSPPRDLNCIDGSWDYMPICTPEVPPRTRKPAPKPENGCALGHSQISDEVNTDHGYRFGTKYESRIEIARLPGRHSGEYDISVEISTNHSNGGLIFYGGDKIHNNFVSLFMTKGKVHIRYSCHNGTKSLVSPESYNDGLHSISFRVNSSHAKLSIDDELVEENQSHCSYGMTAIDAPFYYGGVPNNTDIMRNLEGPYSPFSGCLNKLRWVGQPVTEIRNKLNVIGCNIGNEEKGVFFGPRGGYLKVMERIKVGTEMSIFMEVKPRNSSGLLFSVHGRRDYLLLEIIDNTVVLKVDNGKGPFEARCVLPNKNLLCDGKWHKIHAIKSKNAVYVAVDGISSGTVVGNSISTDTKSGLFIGGHPNLHHGVRGANTKIGYSGCLRNLTIKRNEYGVIVPQPAYGDVLVGVCPRD